MDLYLDHLPEQDAEFRKEAAFGARLSESPENWPQELTSELYKQLPYLSDYDLNVNLDRVDSGRGFAFGYADVANKTERPELEHAEMGLPHIRIPLITIERSVKPFRTFLDGEAVLPLTEERVRETLFNPASFDISATLPRDPSLVEPLMPPTRSGAGYGGEYKMASVRPDLLRAIAPTMSEKEVERFIDKVAADPTIRAGLGRAGVVEELIEVFDKTKRASAEDRLAYIASAIEPTVVTIHKFPGGSFLVKSANVNAFDPGAMKGEEVPPDDAAAALGPENAEAMMPGQTATMVASPVMPQEPVEFQGKPVDEFGEYKVIDTLGNQAMGWVFPETLAWDGNFSPQPIALFTNGSAFALQDSVVGEMVGKGTNLPVDRPIGEGAFYTIGHGEATATAPLTVKSMLAGPDGLPKIVGEDAFGNVVQIAIVEGLSAPQRISDIEYALPSSWKFMRLNNQTQLQGGGQQDMSPEAPEEGAGGMSDEPKQQKPSKKPGAGGPAKKPAPGGESAVSRGAAPGDAGGGAPVKGAQPPPGGQAGPAGGPAGAAPPAGTPAAPSAPKPPGAGKPGADKGPDKGPPKKESKPPPKKDEGKPKDRPTVQVNFNEKKEKPDNKAKKEKTSATLWYNGGFNLDGGCGLHKLGAECKYDLSPVDAEFMLGVLGVDGLVAKQKVAEARRKGHVKLSGLKTITLLAERYQESVKTASVLLRQVPDLRRDLVKEAASLQDPSSVNNLLALNFINPENLNTFISYMPELEETAEKLAEMLLFNYLGMNELPEGAIERSMRNLEEVLCSLKNLSEVEVEEEV